MSTYYYVDPFGEHPTVATSMLQVLENDPDWDTWPDSEVEEESVAKWVRKDERPLQGRLSGWHPIRHLPTGNYLWIDYVAGYDPDMIPESFHFKRYGGNYDAVKHVYDAAYVAGLVFENGAPAVWDEHQMSEYQYDQELQERLNQPGLEEFEAELVHEDLRIKNSMPKFMCDWCGIPARFVVEDTATGTKAFCGETHMAMFLGLPIKPQGYYGYEVEMQRGPTSAPPKGYVVEEPAGEYLRRQHVDVKYWDEEDREKDDHGSWGEERMVFKTPQEAKEQMEEGFEQGWISEKDGWKVIALRAEGWQGISLTGGLEDIDEMLGRKIRKAAESSSAINLEDGDTHKIVIQRGTIPYGVIEISRAGDEVDIYSRRYHSLDSKHFKAPYQPDQTLGDYFTPDLVYTSIVSDDWMTSALRFGDGPASAEEYAAHGDMGFIARYAYEPTEHFNDPQWNETHGAETYSENKFGLRKGDPVLDHAGKIISPMERNRRIVESIKQGLTLDWIIAWGSYGHGKRLDITGTEAEVKQVIKDKGLKDYIYATHITHEEAGGGGTWYYVHSEDGQTFVATQLVEHALDKSRGWLGAEEEFAEIEWELDQQPDLFTDWMSWCERFPTDRNLHQQILIDTYREETGHIGSWDTALEWWHTLAPRTQESIINTGKVWNSFLTWRNSLMWAAEDVNQVTKDQIHWLKENRFPILINVLDPKYAKELSVPGSLNIPISKPDQFKNTVLKRIPKRDALIIVYCANQSCDASYRAYNALKRMGYTNVFEYDAGVEGWFWPLTLEIEEKWQNRAEEYPPWVVSARKVLYGNDWWDIDWTSPDDSSAPKKEHEWADIEWDAESDPNAYKGGSTNTPSMSSMQQMTLPTLYKQDTKGKLRQWTISVEPHSSGTGFMLVSESGLVSGNIKREEGKHITAGSQNRTPFQQAELQARSKWKKKSDKGYYDDLQKAKGQTKTLPMTAHSFYGVKNGVKSYKRGRDITYPAIAQRKYDGVRAHLQVLPNGTVRITSRSGLPTGLMLTDIRNEALKLNLPDNIILDGEIYAGQKPGTTEPLHPLRLINGAVSTQTMKPKHLQILNDVSLYVYDAVLLDDPNADFVTRYRTAAKYIAPYTGNKFKLVPNYIVKDEKAMNNLFGQFLQEGYEGLMVRNAKGPYQFSRSKNLQKVKPVEDDEFEIIGYKEGKGSHAGMVIWECALPNGKTFSVVPKGTHADRKKWFQEAQQGQHVGKLLTVEYAYLTDDGVPFHPTGKNFYVKV